MLLLFLSSSQKQHNVNRTRVQEYSIMYHNHQTTTQAMGDETSERIEPARRRRPKIADAAFVVGFIGFYLLFALVSGSSKGSTGSTTTTQKPPQGGMRISISHLRSSKDETPFTDFLLHRERALQADELQGKTNSDRLDFGECLVAPAVVPRHPIQPTYTTSYPGSGDKLLFQLIEAITGLVTGDDRRSNGHKNTVTINTHFPCPEGVPTRDLNVPRTILLIRNPLDAIYSYFNYVHATHSGKIFDPHVSPTLEQAPLKDWVEWRETFFEGQLQNWLKHIEYWLEFYPTSFSRLLVSYEHFVDEKFGPANTQRIAEFLSRSDGVATSIRPPADLPCLWNAIINGDSRSSSSTIHSTVGYSAAGSGNTASSSTYQEDQEGETSLAESAKIEIQSTLQYDRPFSGRQFRSVVMGLTQLLEKYRSDKVLAPIIIGYVDDIQRRIQKQLGDKGASQFVDIGVEDTQLVDGRIVAGSIKQQ